ncbi:PadR family transcriptional regulator [Bacillus mycoides]|uniref:PadR family transcriptional regulator n=1 Tax=Bacillus mycoides TaxID=1405 RepID=UPI002E1CFF51|nr:PadR family transcriptional regulator [Bacillus mycoides]MED1054409.1 PadR family transcriptional regulator [Bacillus mycoides]
MGLNLEDVKFFIETPEGESVEIKGGVQEVSIASDKIVDSDFDFGKEYSGTFTYEEPKNIKELQDIGFTPQQAWNIHLRKGESWKEN